MRERDIPIMIGCTSCGDCCGPATARPREVKRIRALLRESGEDWRTDQRDAVRCGFYRQDDGGKCAIYEARPFLCRTFGVARELPCPYFPDAVRMSLPTKDAVLHHNVATGDRFLGEAFEGPKYLERLATYLEGNGKPRTSVDAIIARLRAR